MAGNVAIEHIDSGLKVKRQRAFLAGVKLGDFAKIFRRLFIDAVFIGVEGQDALALALAFASPAGRD